MRRGAADGPAGVRELDRTFEQLEALMDRPLDRVPPVAVLGGAGISEIARLDVGSLSFAEFDRLGQCLSDRGGRAQPELIERLLADQKTRTSAEVARDILDGLLPMLLLPIATDHGQTDGAGRSGAAKRIHRTGRADDVWLMGVRLAQVALWLVERAATDPAARDLLPRVRETMFLLSSAPLRVRDRVGSNATTTPHGPADPERLTAFVAAWRTPEATRGKDPVRERYSELAWRSRADWLACLDTYERHPSLVADGPDRLDERLCWLVFPGGREVAGGGRGALKAMRADPVLWLAPSQVERDGVSPAAEGRHGQRARVQEEQLLLHVASDHLLPRYLLDEAFGLLLSAITHRPARSWQRRFASWVPTLVVAMPFTIGVLAAIAILVLPGWQLLADLGWVLELGRVRTGPAGVLALEIVTRAAAVVWIAALAGTLVLGGRAGSYLGLLRIPAAVAFGLAIVLSLETGWVQSAGREVGGLPLLLLGLAGGYLLVEVINQGAEGWRVVSKRVWLLASIGLGSSTMVTALVLWLVAPVFLPGVDPAPDLSSGLSLLLTAASASFTLGVFLQAIWDESPVTAPLSRVRLR